MAARMLSASYDVTVLEEGRSFRPLPVSLDLLTKVRRTGLFVDPRMIQWVMPNMRIDQGTDTVMVYGRGVGGTTTLATGNAVRADQGLRRLGIDLDEEFDALHRELPITTDHERFWSPITRRTFSVMTELGMDPTPMPKFLRTQQCARCGHCSIGCPTRAKWDARELLDGLRVVTGCRVTHLELGDGRARRVHARMGWRHETFDADLIVVAAGGMGTPDILQRSGIPCQSSLFVDPVLCVAAPMPGVRQDRQLLMPFVSRRDWYIISPYMDWLSFFFHYKWNHSRSDMVSLMVKLADVEQGDVQHRHMLKSLTPLDYERLRTGVWECRDILERMGAKQESVVMGILNAGHPGGMLPLTSADASTLHPSVLPDNVYVCDASLLPQSLGLPPMLTIMALAKRIAKIIQG